MRRAGYVFRFPSVLISPNPGYRRNPNDPNLNAKRNAEWKTSSTTRADEITCVAMSNCKNALDGFPMWYPEHFNEQHRAKADDLARHCWGAMKVHDGEEVLSCEEYAKKYPIRRSQAAI